ncbi:hypothetical protein BB427_23160 [Pseudoalteromonas sp. BMB]|uniref:DUF4303 domain-containing protein n=1 Tax=Pseudoalteromonas sp. BMB TaxID=1874619 RepID=UPI00083D12F5|nr:DUF4303 domain-containing protein [Pseudoalteromonas sp. BMB]ODB43556.1 hypothetical protein BB427_23160 [Pseudoalteromonas sp. BMB]
MNLTDLETIIEQAIRECFSQLKSQQPESELIAFGLYCDSNCSSLAPSANSNDHLNSLIEEDPEDSTYYKWSPGEWDFEGEGSEYFQEISKQMTESLNKATSDAMLNQHKLDIAQIAVNSLKAVKDSGFFNELGIKPIIVFSILDFEDSVTEKSWIKYLNTETEFLEFERWINQL